MWHIVYFIMSWNIIRSDDGKPSDILGSLLCYSTSNPIYRYGYDVTLIATVASLKSWTDISVPEWSLPHIWLVSLLECETDALKFKCLCISCSYTLNPSHGPFLVNGSPLTVCDELDVLGVKFNSKLFLMSFTSLKLGIVRKTWHSEEDLPVFGNKSVSASCFRCCIPTT